MRITRLQLHEFGRHRDLDIELSSGFTIIRGPNEAGKSTIQRGLELALFRKPTATTGELDTLRSWGAGQDDRSATRIEFVVDDEVGATGQITTRHGVLEKDFRGQRGRVALQVGDEMFTDPARAEEVIAELTGVPNEAFFRSTASIAARARRQTSAWRPGRSWRSLRFNSSSSAGSRSKAMLAGW